MKQIRIFLAAFILLAVLQVATSSFLRPAKHFGLDTYAVFLNEKQLIRRAVNVPFTLQQLQLNKSNSSDKLVIHYSQCNAENRIGKNRSLSIRDSRGHIVKEWRFTDISSGESVMTVPVKDLLQIDKSIAASDLSLFYAAEGRTEGQQLINLQVRI